MNIFYNFIQNTIVKCNDQDPLWIGGKTKAKIKMENWVYKEYIKNDHPEVLFYLRQNLVSEIPSYVSEFKNDYFVRLFYLLQNLAIEIPFYVWECKNDCFVRFGEKIGDSLCLESHTGLRWKFYRIEKRHVTLEGNGQTWGSQAWGSR